MRVEGENVDLYLHQTNPDLPPQVGVFVVTDCRRPSPLPTTSRCTLLLTCPPYLDRDSVPADVLEKERARTLEKITLEEGKPANIVPKIVEGRMNAFYKENCLVDQAYAKDPKTTVGKVVAATGGKINGFARFRVGA